MSGSQLGGRIERWLAVGALAVILAGSAFASVARGDGDPASDYLLSNQVFLGSQSPSVTSSERQLVTVVAAANRAGFHIRVAIIPTDYDLGSITALWRRPRIYARFLGTELSLVDRQPLLVAMPNGFGFDWPGHATASPDRLLADVPVIPAGAGLDRAAQMAVIRLARAAGVRLAAPPDGGPARAPAAANGEAAPAAANGEAAPAAASGGAAPAAANGGAARAPVAHASDRLLVIAAVVLALGVGLALVFGVRRRRRVGPAVSRPWSSNRPSTVRLRLVLPSVAIACGLAVGVPLVVVHSLRAGAASDVAAGSVVTPPPVSWPAGRRTAPDFMLRDQDGHRVSVAAYRGRPVIVTFVDPLCRNLCPLEAHVLNAAVGQMPASQRPAILAVSVDVWADARADLLQDERRWQLVPQWHWAVGAPARLAAVWKQYEIGVKVTTKKIAQTTIKYVTHTEGAYVIDATGHERALFLWPFWPQDVERSLRELT